MMSKDRSGATRSSRTTPATRKNPTNSSGKKNMISTTKTSSQVATTTSRCNASQPSSFQLLEDWISHNNTQFHHFDPKEAAEIRQALLDWYYENRRKLPWRGDAPPYDGSTAGVNNGNNNGSGNNKKRQKTNSTRPSYNDDAKQIKQSAYGIWVSEIMLQQTRVEAVIPYWLKWMESFPTVQVLAKATEDQVNAHWAGLGFYRRARLLHQGAQYVVNECKGEFPNTIQEILKIPGVGPYTAGAIASIAFDVCTPVVDGNVCRVLSRLRGIANHIKAPIFKDRLAWDLADQIVTSGDKSSPGDVNQALMELGATYCAPSGTGIDENDPLRDYYWSTRLGKEYYDYYCLTQSKKMESNVNAKRIEKLLEGQTSNACELCGGAGLKSVLEELSAAMENSVDNAVAGEKEDMAKRCGHMVFPTSPPKSSKREEVLAVAAIFAVIEDKKDPYWLLVKRPKKGLLAGQWEFPSVSVWDSSNSSRGNSKATNDSKTAKKSSGTKRKAPASSSKKEKGAIEVPAIPATVRRKAMTKFLGELKPGMNSLKLNNLKTSPMEHIFSHIRHTMWIDYACVTEELQTKEWSATNGKEVRWMRESDMKELGITSGVKKILKAVKDEQEKNSKKHNFFQPRKQK